MLLCTKDTQQHCICGPLAPAGSPLGQDPTKGSGSANFRAVRVVHGPSYLVISPKRTSSLNLVSLALLTWPVMVALCGVSSDFSSHRRQVPAFGVCVAPMPWDNCQPLRRAFWLCSVLDATVGSEVLQLSWQGGHVKLSPLLTGTPYISEGISQMPSWHEGRDQPSSLLSQGQDQIPTS